MRATWWVAILGVACGGGSGGSGSRAEVCADLCARFAECGDAETMCEEDCVTDDLFRDDFFPLYLDCVEASCANIGEVCFVMVQDDLTTLPAETTYVTDCEAREVECGAPFRLDLCHAEDVRFFSADYIETELQGCLDLGCTEIELCLEEKILDAF